MILITERNFHRRSDDVAVDERRERPTESVIDACVSPHPNPTSKGRIDKFDLISLKAGTAHTQSGTNLIGKIHKVVCLRKSVRAQAGIETTIERPEYLPNRVPNVSKIEKISIYFTTPTIEHGLTVRTTFQSGG